MTVLHHRIHVLQVGDERVRRQLLATAAFRRAVLVRLDETHWVIEDRFLTAVEKLMGKAGIRLSVVSHGE
ncbi:hypothetical protein GX586_06005 [bacterium]|nr:hypothetical protein [bacterium]